MKCAVALLGLLLVEFPLFCVSLKRGDDDGNDDGDDDQFTPDDDAEVPAQGPGRTPTQAVVVPSSVPAKVNIAVAKQTHAKLQYNIGAAPAPAPAPAAAPATDAQNAQIARAAAASAKSAAEVANNVTKHSIHLAHQSQDALSKAHDALHKARVDSAGLSGGQKRSLKAAEAKLKEATKRAEYGEIKNAQYMGAKAKLVYSIKKEKLQKMDKKMQKVKKDSSKASELESMRQEIQDLREELKTKEGDNSDVDALLKDLLDEIEQMEASEKKGDGKGSRSHDEMKAEIERLRKQIEDMDDKDPDADTKKEDEKETNSKYDVDMKPLSKSNSEKQDQSDDQAATPVRENGIDIDTAMPYGDLEPFGREDTAQELTESSIKESDQMVDQLERAEVAEEKRSVFRALTRLRGAAITSFDGVARSQTGNIDGYNKIHKWRNSHPLHHLADEESDISKWAFPDNAD